MQRDSVVAVVAAGYADGLRRTLSGRIDLLIRGRRVPQLGEIKQLEFRAADNSYTLYPDPDADTIERIRQKEQQK